jgi:phosphatidylglycerophosphate synthase
VKPNHLTTLRLVTGLAAAVAFALGTPGWRSAGAALLVLSLLLDRADGELARLSNRISQSGHRYDLYADGLSNGAVFVGIGIGLNETVLGMWSLPLGILAAVAVVLGELFLMRLDTLRLVSTADIGGYAGFDPDDGMFVVPLAIVLGWDLPLLLAAGVGAPIAALVIALMFLRQQDVASAAKDSGSGE